MANQHKMDQQTPLQEGEFRRIKGIAEATEQSLHAAGIMTFKQLASLTPEEIAEAVPGVGVKERVIRQDWIGQAAEFARQLAPVESDETSGHQHYESFMIELLLVDGKSVRRTKITHIQSGDKESWPSWDHDRLTGWIFKQADIARNADYENRSLKEEPEPDSLRHTQHKQLGGKLKLGSIQIVSPVSKHPKNSLYPMDHFTAQVHLDLSEVEGLHSTETCYRAAVQVLSLSGKEQFRLGQTEGVISPVDPFILEIPLPGLAEGSYHLEAAVMLFPKHSTSPEKDGLYALTEGRLVRITSNPMELREPSPS